MAVSIAQPFSEGVGAVSKITGSGQTVRQVDEYTVPYLVKSTLVNESPDVVLSAVGLPKLGDALSTNSLALVKERRPKQDIDAPKKWIVEIVYSTDTGDTSRTSKDPTLRPPDITWGSNRQQKAVDVDQLGQAVVNSAGEKFDPPLQRDDTRVTLTIGRNEISFDPAIILAYQDAVNSDAFFSGAPLTWKVSSISAALQYEQGVPYWRVTYTFEYNPDQWIHVALDQGKNQLVNGALDGIRVKGSMLSGAVCLNGNGRPLYKVDGWLGSSTTLLNPGGDLRPGDTEVFLTDNSPFDPNGCVVKIDNELLFLTPNPGPGADVVLRGFANTTPAAHAAGATVQQEPVYLGFQIYPAKPFSVFGFQTQ